MESRIDYTKYAQDAQKSLYALERYLSTSGLDHKLIHLLKLRASQINGLRVLHRHALPGCACSR
jgi:hypothetical protein